MHTKSLADTSSYWETSASMPQYARLERDADADVVVVGAGITGLTAAYLLTQAGRSVIVLERDTCSRADTGHTTAHLTMVTDARLTDLISRFGRPQAQAVWDAGLAAMAQIDATVRALDIDCGFEWVDGYLHAPHGSSDEREGGRLEEEASAARELGFDAEFLPYVPWAGRPGVRFDGQARFHPRRYLSVLAEAIVRRGGRIHEHTGAETFSDRPLRVTAGGHAISCRDVVMATHNPLVGVDSTLSASVFQTKLALYTSYVVAGRVAPGTVPDALFWDTADPYQYVRLEPQRDYDLVIFGGEDHKTGQVEDTRECYVRLERALVEQVPGIEITHRWSGQVIETPDGLPYIGSRAEHQYAATGFAGNGLTFGTLAGMMMSDAILGRRNPWAGLFSPDRSALRRGAWDYLKENADYPYYLVRDRFAGADGRSLRAVRRGEGRVLERDGRKVAVYRAPDGAVSIRSAICTHLQCVVAWNAAESTWDCPCHGSRFKTTGEVIAGPAESPLPEAADDAPSG
jgi:glycine/D-amino acid oxidase-like deaminating enzyme/nitrite reductase/ring-hydroxylating ferredoxin subunit